MLRRNPQDINQEARYFQSKIISAMAGYSGNELTGFAEQQRLLLFLERIINTTAAPPTQSAHKSYSPTGSDPNRFDTTPKAAVPAPKLTGYLQSSRKLLELEQQARLGDQQAILDYLQILDYQGHIDLNSLWVVPFTKGIYDVDMPDDWIFTQPFPYKLGDDYQTIEEFHQENSGWPEQTIKGAFVVDVGSLELSDLTGYNISNYLRRDVDPENIEIAVKYFILQAEAILKITKHGYHFPDPHEIGGIGSYRKQTSKYWQLLHRKLHPGKSIRGAGPVKTSWPERLVRQLPVAQFPERSGKAPYVIILHTPTMQAFALAGGYKPLDEDVEEDIILHAMRYNRSREIGWLPTSPLQRPNWVNRLLDGGEKTSNFVAYWVAN